MAPAEPLKRVGVWDERDALIGLDQRIHLPFFDRMRETGKLAHIMLWWSSELHCGSVSL